jgi:hypothetical protein
MGTRTGLDAVVKRKRIETLPEREPQIIPSVAQWYTTEKMFWYFGTITIKVTMKWSESFLSISNT